jgi:AcrR family transcriptional regulator
VRANVLAATLDALREDGFAELTVEDVALRSGVHRTTIHRRWPSRSALVADALLEVSASQVPVPNTGNFRSDLRRFARVVRDAISTPLARAIVSALAQPAADAEMVRVASRFWDTRFAATGAIVRRAVERDEIPKRTDPRFVIEALGGPIWFRTLVVGERADDRFLDRVVDTVIAGLQGRNT